MRNFPSLLFVYGILPALLAFFLAANVAWAATLKLNWIDNSSDEEGFHIQRKVGIEGNFVSIAIVGANVTSYSDANLANDTVYCYRVNAFKDGKGSPYSGEACAKTPGSDNAYLDIKANGSDGPVEVNAGQNVTVTVALQPGGGDGLQADWWVADATPFGLYWHAGDKGWVRSDKPIPFYGGPLFQLAPLAVLNTATLPVGTYTFYFAVDLRRNGLLDTDQVYFDTVQVRVK